MNNPIDEGQNVCMCCSAQYAGRNTFKGLCPGCVVNSNDPSQDLVAPEPRLPDACPEYTDDERKDHA